MAVASQYDLGSQFFLREEDVQDKKNRLCTYPLSELLYHEFIEQRKPYDYDIIM